jgi:uncharacterized protein YndB with AHSA1/START domain
VSRRRERPRVKPRQIEELTQPERAVEVERQIAAAPVTVFSYLVEPAKFVVWMGAAAELDPRPGVASASR